MQVVGNKVMGNDGKRLDKGTDHRDAVRLAQDRAMSSASISIALGNTARAMIATDFKDAETWQARELADGQESASVVRAKLATEGIEHDGAQYKGGGVYVTLGADGDIEMIPKREMRRRFTKTDTSKE